MPTSDEIRETQRKVWNKFSPGWKKWDNFVMSWLKPTGDKILELSSLKEKEKMLDVATGTGEPGLSAASRTPNAQVLGVDLSEEMIRIAEENAQKRGIKNYTARVADACHLPFDENSFDVIICRHGIMFFPEIDTALKEFHRVLKPSGRVALSSWGLAGRNNWATTTLGIINKMVSQPPASASGPGLFRCAQEGALVSILNHSQFNQCKQTELSGEILFDSVERYWEFMTDVVAPVVAALSAADSATKEAVKAAVLDEAGKRIQNGQVRLEWNAWVASATK